uniref:hypothetical protein n=1 Tax=Tahibacter caeni TaxID=1453545 RepID=UPI0021471CDD
PARPAGGPADRRPGDGAGRRPAPAIVLDNAVTPGPGFASQAAEGIVAAAAARLPAQDTPARRRAQSDQTMVRRHSGVIGEVATDQRVSAP